VVCIVYAMDNVESFQHIESMWMPAIQRALGESRLCNSVPIILVGNKVGAPVRCSYQLDCRQDGAPPSVSGLLATFEAIDTAIECCARENFNVGELFYFAQRAVMHPRAPLYNTRCVMKPFSPTPLLFGPIDRWRRSRQDTRATTAGQDRAEAHLSVVRPRLRRFARVLVPAACPSGLPQRLALPLQTPSEGVIQSFILSHALHP
jgi:hypothetical protein